MPEPLDQVLHLIFDEYQEQLLEKWVESQLHSDGFRSYLVQEDELREQCSSFVTLFVNCFSKKNHPDMTSDAWAPMAALLTDIAKRRTNQGFTPSETATFVFSLKRPLFHLIKEQSQADAKVTERLWEISLVLDTLGLFTTEVYLATREEVITRQREEMFELSCPVVQLWDGVLGLPIIGTLDSKRTQLVMESLLETLSSTQSEITIIDITGVPVVDTLTAQHLIRTVSAAQLMGARCIISGIRPQIAQTMVHLGVSLGDVVTKSTMAAAIKYAFEFQGLEVNPINK
ncbi:STAS domain-containing protein [Alteromonas lipotrueiana]|uniref:STAS domain-containing protein n=1 Tax=Alteromonas lipotrueiana TaxID=2803815 RepID=UPI001C45DB3E|nr:STAS domain-containing protein [Alteromonas lipotrueiana]